MFRVLMTNSLKFSSFLSNIASNFRENANTNIFNPKFILKIEDTEGSRNQTFCRKHKDIFYIIIEDTYSVHHSTKHQMTGIQYY